MMSKPSVAVTLAILALLGPLPSAVDAQENPRWQRSEARVVAAPTIFHGTEGLNLPTAVTPGKGELVFEIAHRFLPPISDAENALFGLDGGVRLRLGLTYGLTDAFAVALVRSNLDDNLDLGARLRVLDGTEGLPVQVALATGVAWNTEVFGGEGSTTQARASLIINGALTDGLAVGLVPSWVSNPLVTVDGEDAVVSLGIQARASISSQVALVGEYVLAEDQPELANDPASLSVELETGGHFFRIGVTNSVRLNPAQHVVGAAQPFEPGEWRLAFNITRVLAF